MSACFSFADTQRTVYGSMDEVTTHRAKSQADGKCIASSHASANGVGNQPS